MSNHLAQGITWDLSDLYRSADDPQIEADLVSAETQAVRFEKKYKTLFSERPNGSASLADLMKDYKEIITRMTKPAVFSHLAFAKDPGPRRRRFHAKDAGTANGYFRPPHFLRGAVEQARDTHRRPVAERSRGPRRQALP